MLQLESQALPRKEWHVLWILKSASLVVDVLPEDPEPRWEGPKHYALNLRDFMGGWWGIVLVLNIWLRHLGSEGLWLFIRLFQLQILDEIRARPLICPLCAQEFVPLLLKKLSLVFISDGLEFILICCQDPLDVFNYLQICDVNGLAIFLDFKMRLLAIEVLNLVIHGVVVFYYIYFRQGQLLPYFLRVVEIRPLLV